ncbi:serine-enriched protein-like isoform X2 [Apostichopus japonicus]|uniref:serine-enriched protein-like isoform X2 n=1 Tax=Stichopus japonicus TaxID=307972 RepID=UPI003AB3010F
MEYPQSFTPRREENAANNHCDVGPESNGPTKEDLGPIGMEFASFALRGEPAVLDNKLGLAEDLGFLSRMPELCDVTFLVGEKKEPVGAVRAILATRSRVFHKILYSHQSTNSQKKITNSPDNRKLQKKVSRLIRRNSFDAKDFEANRPRTITVEEFEPSVFRQLVDYCHTGCATLKPRNILGLLNAADHYGLEELRRACLGFLHGCINVDTVCLLLKSAEKYIQYKATKSLVQKALEFVDTNGESVLRLPFFTSLPEHVVRLILSREDLRAEEITKFQAVLFWSRAHVERNPGMTLKAAISPFLECISFHHIPATTLMQSVRPTNVVPDQKIMTALAYQADPTSIDLNSLPETPTRLRLSLLNLTISSDEPTNSIKSDSSSQIGEQDNVFDYPESMQNYDVEDYANASVHTCHSDETSYYRRADDGNSSTSEDFDVESRKPRGGGCESDKGDSQTVTAKITTQEVKDISSRATGTLSQSNSVCCSMSTCSELTDSGSSAGGSFGKADQRNSLFKDTDGIPVLP